MKDEELLDWAIKNKRVDILVKHKWGFDLSKGQIEIVRKVAFLEKKRISVSAMTRYGKTQCVAIVIALLIDFGLPVKIGFLGPKQEQAGILREYMSELILADPSLLAKAQITATGEERIGKEASRKRMTFKTGAEYRVFSGEGDAGRLMGFGCVPPDAELFTDKGLFTAEDLMKQPKGIKILSYNQWTRRSEFKLITHFITNLPRELFVLNYGFGSVVVTDNHPVYVVGRGYVQAKNVRVNDKLFKCNYVNEIHGNNLLLSLQKPDKSETKPHKKNQKTILQQRMPRRIPKRQKQPVMDWWAKNCNMSRMQTKILNKQKPEKRKNLLQFQMPRRSAKEETKKENKQRMRVLFKSIQSYTCAKRIQILFKSMRESWSFRKNDERKESFMARRDKKSSLDCRLRQEIETKNKNSRLSSMFSVWEKRLFTDSSYRLRQEKQSRKQPNYSLRELSLQNELQKRDVETVTVQRITKKPRGKVTYNFEVEHNHNYFVDGILTHNCDILIRDEACLLNREAYTKSSRMIGDNPEEAIIIELYNPWKRDNQAFEHTLDPEWDVIQIGWEQAVREGRTTKKFIDQQRKDLMPLEFTVLYESLFPEQGEDSLFNLSWVKEAEIVNFNLSKKLNKIIEEIDLLKNNKTKMGEGAYLSKMKPLEEERKKYLQIISCDPAEKGLDETVVFWGIEYDNKYEVVGIWSEPKSEPIKVVGKVVSIAEDFIHKEVRGKINIDRIGIGSGPLSRLKEVIRVEKGLKNIQVFGCHYGEKAMKSDIFHNKKAENYFRLSDLMRGGMISIPENHKLRTQLVNEEFDRTSSNKKIIKDPENKSPDYADALVYLIWKDKKGLAFDFS